MTTGAQTLVATRTSVASGAVLDGSLASYTEHISTSRAIFEVAGAAAGDVLGLAPSFRLGVAYKVGREPWEF